LAVSVVDNHTDMRKLLALIFCTKLPAEMNNDVRFQASL
jgi:hypothetical protein